MAGVFIYWDNSNIFIGAKQAAAEREGGYARSRVRIDFQNLLKLASAGRDIKHAIAVGSIPPELRHVWYRLEGEGVSVKLLERGAMQAAMLRDGLDYNGIAVMLTDDGVGFHADMERMHNRGWGIEVLSWRHSCNRRMQDWAQQNGEFIALDDFYDSITFLEPALTGQPIANPREVAPLDLSKRPILE